MNAYFDQAVLNPELNVGFYVKIQGIPFVFFDGEVARDSTGNTWAAPTSKGQSYVLLPNALDVSKGLRDVGAAINRRECLAEPGAMTVTLRDDARGTLRRLFAREHADGHVANLTDSLDYDDGTGSVIHVDSTDGWPSSGLAYFGRETIYYNALAGTTIGTGGSKATRDLFSLGMCDARYVQNSNLPRPGARIIATYPRVWHGRYVQVYAYIKDVHGYAYDDGLDGRYCAEIYRGILQGNPRVAANWRSWELATRSIDVILNTDVGRESLEGMLVQVPGSKDDQEGGIVQVDGGGSAATIGFAPMGSPIFWVDANTRYVEMEIAEWSDLAAYNGGTAPTIALFKFDVSNGTPPNLMTLTQMKKAVELINTTIHATFAGVSVVLGENALFDWVFTTAATKVHRVTLFGSRLGSCLPLLGMRTDHMAVLMPDSWAIMIPETEAVTAYLSPTATTIPFFPVPSLGLTTADIPSQGFARIADKEIVQYTGLSDLSDTLAGMLALTGVTRGAFGTEAIEHVVKLDGNWKATQEVMKLQFGIGLQNVNVIDAILQFALSTGSGRHGPYDVLVDGVSPGLCPAHFDLPSIEAAQDGLPASLRVINDFVSKPGKLPDLIKGWLQAAGVYLASGPCDDGTYRIRAYQVLPPLESGDAVSLDADGLDGENPAEFAQGNDEILTAVSVSYLWDVLKESAADGAKVNVINDDAEQEYGERHQLEWTLRGHQWSSDSARASATVLAAFVFQRFGAPYDILDVHTDRRGWLLHPGDNVQLTVAGPPSPEGDAGFTARRAVVVAVKHTYHAPGGAVGSVATLVFETQVRQSAYAMAGRVTAYDAGTHKVTLVETAFSPTGRRDADAFKVGDDVYVYNEGDAGTRDKRTVIAIVNNVLTLSSALTVTVGAHTIIVAADYTDGGVNQTAHAHIAANGPPSALTGGQAFRYV